MLPGESTTLNAQLAFVQGDTWGGIPVITLDPVPNYSVSSARMPFRESGFEGAPVVTLTSAAGGITINNASTWSFTMPAQALPLPAGTYDWQFQTTDSQGSTQTYLQGTITVEPDFDRT